MVSWADRDVVGGTRTGSIRIVFAARTGTLDQLESGVFDSYEMLPDYWMI